MRIIYDYYRIFYYAAKYQSFTRAADILMSSQPNVTRAMNTLEHELNCRLFLRSNRGVALTPEGEKLFAHVQIAQEQLQAGELELAGTRSLQSGYVSLGISEAALHGTLLPVLREFHLTYPGVHIRIMNHSTPQAVEAIKNGIVELAITTTPTGISRPLSETLLKEFQDILIAGPHFSALQGTTIHLEELRAYPLVCLGPHTKTYSFYDHWFAEHGQILQPDIEVATTDQILPMVKHDLGIGFLPEYFARDAIADGKVFPIQLAEPFPARHICLLKDKSRSLSIAARKLEEMLWNAAEV